MAIFVEEYHTVRNFLRRPLKLVWHTQAPQTPSFVGGHPPSNQLWIAAHQTATDTEMTTKSESGEWLRKYQTTKDGGDVVRQRKCLEVAMELTLPHPVGIGGGGRVAGPRLFESAHYSFVRVPFYTLSLQTKEIERTEDWRLGGREAPPFSLGDQFFTGDRRAGRKKKWRKSKEKKSKKVEEEREGVTGREWS
jgi:hypothetical protein